MSDFPAFFNSDWEKPSSYWDDDVRYWDECQALGENTIALNFTFNVAGQFNDFEKEVRAGIINAFKSVALPKALLNKAKIHVPEDNNNFTRDLVWDGDIFSWDDKNLTKRLKSIGKLITEEYKKQAKDISDEDELADLERDTLNDWGNGITLLVPMENDPEPNLIQTTIFMPISSDYDSMRHGYIPQYGYSQGFSEGELDTGNQSDFIPYEQVTFSDDEAENEEEDGDDVGDLQDALNDLQSEFDRVMREQEDSAINGEYVGELNEDGQQHGQGTLTDKDGSSYTGSWMFDVRSGKGIQVWANGSKYEGEWENGQQHGQGKFNWADGSYYEGSWVAGSQEGRNY